MDRVRSNIIHSYQIINVITQSHPYENDFSDVSGKPFGLNPRPRQRHSQTEFKHVPSHATTVARSRRQHHHRDPRQDHRHQNHPHPVPKLHAEIRAGKQRIDVILDDDHQGHVGRKHDAPDDRSHDGDDEREDGDGMRVQEQGQDKDDGRERRRDEVEREDEQQTRLGYVGEIRRESDSTEETRRDRVTELRTITFTRVQRAAERG